MNGPRLRRPKRQPLDLTISLVLASDFRIELIVLIILLLFLLLLLHIFLVLMLMR